MPVWEVQQEEEQNPFEGKKTIEAVWFGIAERAAWDTDKNPGNQDEN